MDNYLKRKIIFLFILLLVVSIIGIVKGSVDIPLVELLNKNNWQILALRFFRILIAIVAGCGLSISGTALQAILRNSLSEPYLLGTSSGAGLGAALAIIIGISQIYLPLAAFIGAIASILIVYNIARQNNRIPEQSLILSGVIVSIALSAIIVFLISTFEKDSLHGLTWWLWGSLQVYDFKLLGIVSAIVISGIIIIYIFSQDLNAISIGEEEATHLGIEVEKVKKILIIVTVFITAAIVCICGIIGFVGLMIPHIMRLVVGSNHKILIPTTCLGAAIFMIICDILSRTIFPPLEIPIGVITAILGAPTFIFLLKRRQLIK